MEHLPNDHADHLIQQKDMLHNDYWSYAMTITTPAVVMRSADSIDFALYDLHHFIISIVFSTCRKVMMETNQ